MSGHSKWSNIKYRKEAQDKKREKLFTKLLRSIAIAAREGGVDPGTNAKLRLAVERARSFSVPKANIERALSKKDGEHIEEVSLDAIGPGGAVLIIDCATDNRNRTVSELRHLLEKHGGKLAQEGAARWAFTRAGLIAIERPSREEDNEEIVLALVDAGAEDVQEEPGSYTVVTRPEALAAVRVKLEESGITPADSMLGWYPSQLASLSSDEQKEMHNLVTALDEHNDVQAVWSNIG